MSGQQTGVNISQVLAEMGCWPDHINKRGLSRIQRTITRMRERLGFSQEGFVPWSGLSGRNVMLREAGDVKPTRMARRLILDLLRKEMSK